MVNTQHFDCQIDGKVSFAGGFPVASEVQSLEPDEKLTDRCLLIRQNRIRALADEITLFSEKPGNPLEGHIQIER